jgi:DNA-binding XRE family transcriptional regulator
MKGRLHRRDRWNAERTINPYVTEARARERFWQEFRIEMELIGARFRKVRLDHGYSLESVAKALKIPKRRLSQIERGMYKHFEIIHLDTLCEHYNTTRTHILSVLPGANLEGVEYWKYREPDDRELDY